MRLTLACVIAALWSFSFGLGTQATSHWLKIEGASDTLVGLVHAAYYLGVAATSLLVPMLTRRFGLRTVSMGLFVSSVSLAAFPLADGGAGWLALRFVSGAGCATCLVPMETFISRHSPADRRTEYFGYYAVALTVAGAAGIAIGLEGFNPDGVLIQVLGSAENAFFVGAVFPFLAGGIAEALLVRDAWDDAPAAAVPVAWRKHVLSFGTAWGQGFLEGGMLAFLSLYLVSRGLSTSTAGVLMGLAMIGVIAFQVPVAWVADRCGRQPTLLACYAVALAGLLAVPWCESAVWLGVWLFLFGACSGAMYPLGLSLLDDSVPASSLARAYAWYMTMECIGSQMGAAAMGRARDLWGPTSMFFVAAAGLAAVLAVWGATGRAAISKRSAAEKRREAA